jgi:UDP-N-acetylmuramoylalanine--D-glutamate ligase
MNFSNLTIGIFGRGITGMALCRFFADKAKNIILMDLGTPTTEEQATLEALGIRFIPQSDYAYFFAQVDLFVPSPGIDLSLWQFPQEKLLSELDLFSRFWQGRIIAITGSVGKTTITSALHHLLTVQHQSAVLGGNIGIGMADLLTSAHNTPDTYAVLELSSFQLEQARSFAPDLALVTNIVPNHLDRHKTLQAYCAAKYAISKRQRAESITLLPAELLATWTALDQQTHRKQATYRTFGSPQDQADYQLLPDGSIMNAKTGHTLTPSSQIPESSFKQNWLIIAATLDLLGCSAARLKDSCASFELPAHRCSKILTHNEVDYINDSKATVPESTLAAIAQIDPKRTIFLLLGGISKGIDRTSLIANLPTHVQHIYCFGGERAQLLAICEKVGKQASAYSTMEEAVQAAHAEALPGTTVLLSPAGASLDLFRNYQERGKRFEDLARKLCKG